MSSHKLLFLIVHIAVYSTIHAELDFPSFDWFHPQADDKIRKGQEPEEFHFGQKHEEDHRGQEVEEINFGSKPDHKGQELEEFHFPNQKHIGQEVEEINFGSKPDHPKGQEVEDVIFGPKTEEHHKGQEIEEINFGPKHEGQEIEEINFGPKQEKEPKHEEHKGQEVEKINFGSKEKEDHKGQEVEEINFGPKHEKHPKGQEIEEINFGPKHEDHKGQEIEEINFGSKPGHPKGQEVEDVIFGPKTEEHHKGQEVEEINFGPKHEEHPKGQEIEEINFSSKQKKEPEHEEHKEHEGQEVEEINFGPKPDHPKGQVLEEIHFNPNHKEDHKGQEVEEINFGSKPDHKGQEVEEIPFGPKENHVGQEVEEINFGPKHEEHPKGQEIEEINFGSKQEKEPEHKGQEVEEINFDSKHEEHPKGQEVEEVNFGPKHEKERKGQETEEFHFGSKEKEDLKGQEVEEIPFGSKEEDHKGQEVEEINFGPKPVEDDKGEELEEINFASKPGHKGQEVEEVHFGPKENHVGQEIEEINFGPKLEEHPKGQEIEEINFGSKQEKEPEHKGQEVEGINFGPKHEEHPKGQEVEEINFEPKQEEDHKGQEVEEINFGSKPHDPKGQKIEEIHFGPKEEDHKGQEVEEINFGPKDKEHGQGQEVEEINFNPNHEREPKGQEVEEIHFDPKEEDHKGQEVEEINFGPKHEEHPKGQEVEEINFGPKLLEDDKGQELEEINFNPNHEREPKGQEVEEIHFDPKEEDHKGQEVEEINFGPNHEEHPKGQEVEEINFGPKHEEHPKGQEVEEINFDSKHEEHPKGQEVEEINFDSKHEEHPKGQEVEEINFGPKHEEHPKGQEVEEINFGPKLLEDDKGQELEEISFVPKPNDGGKPGFVELPEPKENEGNWFDIFLPAITEKGCTEKPKVPSNAFLNCDGFHRFCELTCQEGYSLPELALKVEFFCDGSKWVPSTNVTLRCDPVCEPPCLNDGICIGHNRCHCPKNFEGPKCQFGHKPCLNHPPVSHNSYVNCNSSNCLVKCFDNYSFPDGSTTAGLICREGEWTWERPDWNSLNECKPSCTPPCINGGTCLDFNKCQCPRQYVGSQCQYELAACDAKKLNFNGYYTCKGENDKVSCSLSCPEGHDADAPLAKEYICEYSAGKFFPEPVPQCLYGENTDVIKSASSSHTVQEGFANFTTGQVPHHPKVPVKAECTSWKRSHYKNFDGEVFSFDGSCSYILVQDVIENTFRIVSEVSNCESKCSQSLKIYYENQEYKLDYNDKTVVLIVDGEKFQIPKRFTDLSVEKVGSDVLVSLQVVDVVIKLNAESDVSITVTGNLWNKTGGLCGNFNGNSEDDFYTSDGTPSGNLETFLQSWADDIYNCDFTPTTKNNCTGDTTSEYCNKIFTDAHFEKCFSEKKFSLYREACEWDVCKCGKSCACETISEFVRNCKNHLVSEGFKDSTSDWRQIADCPLNCPPGKVYSLCGPSFQSTCGSFGVNDGLEKFSECAEGCFCPEGLVEFNDSCIRKEYCPCKWRNKYYSRGEEIVKDCNTCTCQNGEWACSGLKCSSRCSAVGNYHYRTFDGKRYDLMGQCSYYLLKSDDYAIESENLACEGSFVDEIFHSYISKSSLCSKLVTIRHKEDEIKLKPKKEVLLNGVEVQSLPLEINGVIIRLTSLFVIVRLPDGTEIWSDGNTNVYIDLPGNHTKSTGGLCGTYNNNQKDDFTTFEGDVEQSAVHFAGKWKSEESCTEILEPSKSHSCDLNVHVKAIAEKLCLKLKGDIFKDCHSQVDVEPFYKNCLNDVCSCQKDVKYCSCPIFADYANECIRQNVRLPWRNEARECGLHCPSGQVYQPHGDSCATSCQDISLMKGRCDRKYIEGCGCPDGLVLNTMGQCIPVPECPCLHQNFKYKPNHQLIMLSENDPQYCTCQNALWSCRPEKNIEIPRGYENSDVICDEKLHEVYTTCVPAEPKTCKNMHEKPKRSTRICFPGCVCKKGFVWDSIGKACVNSSECPCHHRGKSYSEGEQMQQDCNSCTCNNGMWKCTKRECASVCSTWGDSHFKTFDGNIYDFQGSCEFILASGVISEYETFFISLQIVPCGSTGISCPKEVTLKVGSPERQEKVVFSKSSEPLIPGGLKRISVREVGIFIFAEVFDLGISVRWDKGTRVYLKIDSRWKNKVKGLCGNFNDDELDDFKTPSSGETSEISPALFADSWRLQTSCPESSKITDTCTRRPHRKPWAVQKCSVLKSEVFEPCHSEVSPEPYFERCVVDSCGCDEGGDCDCMCSAVAAYAEECTLKGIPIKWRTQELCPIQCHDRLTYNPCVPACPPKSCDNQYQHSALLRTCSEETCVEGCDKIRCPEGHVLADSTSSVCIPITSCKTVCLTVNNVTYLEGDLMESDDCHSCYCSHHRKVCTGMPCHEVTFTTPTVPSTSVCPEYQVWDDCIIKCGHVCNHLLHKLSTELQCSREDDCVSGCRAKHLKCPDGMYFRDMYTCVHKKNCPCVSPSGSFIKPGEVVQESDCEKCQCINNEYECHNVCTISPPTSTIQTLYNYTHKRYTVTPKWDFAQEGNVTLIYHTTTSPPVVCPNRLYESLVDKFTRFSASSHADETSSPVFGQMTANGSWIAADNNADQYLQVDLGRVELVHAVNVAGDSGNYVTAYHLLHSLNGEKFAVVFDQDGNKEVFGGPLDGFHSMKQVLRVPIESRYIRFHPISWHGQISMKVDVLGCQTHLTTTTPHPTTVSSICNKAIGIGQRYLPKLQVVVTSFKPNRGPDFIGFDNDKGWQPLTNSKSEWVQIDFGDYGNFTGIITKGVSQGNELSSPTAESWVERYKVKYSHDGLTWNPVLNEFGEEMTFMGNTDSESEKRNYFKLPIHAKFLRILPVKWHENIGLRLDVLGCYETSHFELMVTPPVEVEFPECNTCKGAVMEGHCKCKDEEWWDGEHCVNHSECPCFVGLIAYPVGSTFTTENCEECTCRVYGVPHCTPKVCQDCPKGLQKVLTPHCGCTCKPCEGDTLLCPTSNVCLDKSAWCNGIQDCPDDELNCTTPTPKAPPTPCQVSCPPGYEIVYKNKTSGPTEAEDMIQSLKTKSLKTKKSVKTYRKTKKVAKLQKVTECPAYDCVPVKEAPPTACPVPECPLDYSVVYKKHVEELEESCPLYACEPIPEFANCTVLSKNVKTFDGTEYKYEICDHVMATHDSGLWNVTMLKNCALSSTCTSVLMIHHLGHVLEIHSQNSSVKVDSFPYSTDQVELLSLKVEDFSLNPIGNSFIFTSNIFGFQLIYDTNGNFKIEVPSSMKGHLGGLCGLYNGHPSDDKTRSDGKLAKTTVDFGDSWFNPGGKECVETVCPQEMQTVAVEICLKLREKPFHLCSEQVNLELCVETTCECLGGNKTVDECRCLLLSDFAAKCKSQSLFGWRVEHDCPSSCPSNLVYYDCYQYACQPTCGKECTEPATGCYSGCFCPDGLVKRGDQCIKVAECRDCVCSGMGDSTYVTFDGGLTFNGNCTYVATRDRNPSGTSNFEVLISNTLCNGSDFMTCTDKVEVIVAGHFVKIVALPGTEEMVEVLIDGHAEDLKSVEKIDVGWGKIGFNPETSSVHVRLPKEHVDVRYFYKRFAFTVSLPSHFYSDRVEGLCGTCSQNPTEVEDLDNPEMWQTEKDENCLIEPPAPCIPTPEHKKICFFMNDPEIFGQCLAFVDPTPFIDQCLTLMCNNGHICNSLEAYGQACRDAGVCVKWRSPDFCPFTCPADLEYQPCSSECMKTCDNYDDVESSCTSSLTEGCFCPQDQVLINGTCKPEKYCEYCDEEGQHFEDEIWHVDKCTKCSCKNHVVTCDKTECLGSDITCEEDEIVVKEENDVDCCPKYKCGCKPREECEKVEIPQDLLPGMEAVMNESGCCPKVDLLCRKENCPAPSPCNQHFIQRMINTTACCPEYFCEKPLDICIYEFGGTQKNHSRTEREAKTEVVKVVGEHWSDGPCKTCVCVERNGFAEAVCSITECPPLTDHHDFNEYILEEVTHDGKCCPEVIRKSCKFNGRVYDVGDVWVPDEKNPCETMKCNDWGGGVVIKETRLEVCNKNCEQGWEYKHSEGSCCGHCVQSGCLAEDKIHKEGDSWLSADGCSKSTCAYKNGQFSISTETKACPSIEDCPPEDIYQDDCCRRCKVRVEDKKICFPQSLPLESTVKLVRQRKGRHGACSNLHPIGNFTRCAGNCDSYTEYKSESGSHEVVCSCCKPEEYSLLEVELKCEDGLDITKKITVPSKCSCMPCGR